MKRLAGLFIAALVAGLVGGWFAMKASEGRGAEPPASIPTFSMDDVARSGLFYVGGKYIDDHGKEQMDGAMYVEVMVPKRIRHQYPLVFFEGAGQTGTDWMQTPDGRPGWAYYFVKQGYVLYMGDYPARGRSPYVPGVDGQLTIRDAQNLEKTFTDLNEFGDWPQAKLYTEWPSEGPNKGKMGDPVFDQFIKGQVQFITNVKQDEMNLAAYEALLDKINTPVILITHSQGGAFGWEVADARPNMVKGIITAEPAGPPIQSVDTSKIEYTGKPGLVWGLTSLPLHYDPPISDPSQLQVTLEEKSNGPATVPCWVQKEPVHKLVNLENIPVLDVSTQASYHREFDACIPKWLDQAGGKAQYVKLEDVGITGNGHELMLEKNSDQIAKYFDSWIEKNVK